MITAESWTNGVSLAMIANSLMIIAAAVLIYVSRSSPKSSKKKEN